MLFCPSNSITSPFAYASVCPSVFGSEQKWRALAWREPGIVKFISLHVPSVFDRDVFRFDGIGFLSAMARLKRLQDNVPIRAIIAMTVNICPRTANALSATLKCLPTSNPNSLRTYPGDCFVKIANSEHSSLIIHGRASVCGMLKFKPTSKPTDRLEQYWTIQIQIIFSPSICTSICST